MLYNTNWFWDRPLAENTFRGPVLLPLEPLKLQEWAVTTQFLKLSSQTSLGLLFPGLDFRTGFFTRKILSHLFKTFFIYSWLSRTLTFTKIAGVFKLMIPSTDVVSLVILDFVARSQWKLIRNAHCNMWISKIQLLPTVKHKKLFVLVSPSLQLSNSPF